MSILSRIGSLTVSFENISGPVWMVLAIAVVAHYFPLKWQGRLVDLFAATPFYAQAAALMLLAVALQYVAASGVAPFIYTKF
jgi:hypothetical protein